MLRADLDGLPVLLVPQPYAILPYRHGDEEHWLPLLRTTLGPSWTTRRWRAEIAADPAFDPSGLFFVVRDSKIVGSAWARNFDHADHPRAGYLQLVAVDARHGGQKLGYWLTVRALQHLRTGGRGKALLDTEDHRLPAIELYLRLGFKPLATHPTHPGRWATVLQQLGR